MSHDKRFLDHVLSLSDNSEVTTAILEAAGKDIESTGRLGIPISDTAAARIAKGGKGDGLVLGGEAYSPHWSYTGTSLKRRAALDSANEVTLTKLMKSSSDEGVLRALSYHRGMSDDYYLTLMSRTLVGSVAAGETAGMVMNGIHRGATFRFLNSNCAQVTAYSSPIGFCTAERIMTHMISGITADTEDLTPESFKHMLEYMSKARLSYCSSAAIEAFVAAATDFGTKQAELLDVMADVESATGDSILGTACKNAVMSYVMSAGTTLVYPEMTIGSHSKSVSGELCPDEGILRAAHRSLSPRVLADSVAFAKEAEAIARRNGSAFASVIQSSRTPLTQSATVSRVVGTTAASAAVLTRVADEVDLMPPAFLRALCSMETEGKSLDATVAIADACLDRIPGPDALCGIKGRLGFRSTLHAQLAKEHLRIGYDVIERWASRLYKEATGASSGTLSSVISHNSDRFMKALGLPRSELNSVLRAVGSTDFESVVSRNSTYATARNLADLLSSDPDLACEEEARYRAASVLCASKDKEMSSDGTFTKLSEPTFPISVPGLLQVSQGYFNDPTQWNKLAWPLDRNGGWLGDLSLEAAAFVVATLILPSKTSSADLCDDFGQTAVSGPVVPRGDSPTAAPGPGALVLAADILERRMSLSTFDQLRSYLDRLPFRRLSLQDTNRRYADSSAHYFPLVSAFAATQTVLALIARSEDGYADRFSRADLEFLVDAHMADSYMSIVGPRQEQSLAWGLSSAVVPLGSRPKGRSKDRDKQLSGARPSYGLVTQAIQRLVQRHLGGDQVMWGRLANHLGMSMGYESHRLDSSDDREYVPLLSDVLAQIREAAAMDPVVPYSSEPNWNLEADPTPVQKHVPKKPAKKARKNRECDGQSQMF